MKQLTHNKLHRFPQQNQSKLFSTSYFLILEMNHHKSHFIISQHQIAKFPSLIGREFSKTGKITEGTKPRIRYLGDTSKSFIYYTTRDEENKSNTLMSRDAKRSNQNP